MSSQKMEPKPLPPLPDGIPFKSQSAAETSLGILMCGGLETNTQDPTLCHLFNRTLWAWQAFPSLLVGGGRGLIFEGAEKIALIGSRITPEGGTNATQIFDGSKWTLGPELPHKSWGLQNVGLNESHHLIVGGYAVGVWFLDEVLIFDMESLAIQQIEPYPERTLIFGALKYSYEGRDYVLCFGDQSDPLDKFMYQLDLDSFTWGKFSGETPVTIVSARSMMVSPNTMWIAGVLSSKWNAGPFSYKLTLKNGEAIWNETPPLASSQVMLGTLERELIE
ncbi:uncharacterized protein LOC131881994 isoform X2 [Tigriopus californicus]|nr:uncharacterized protein LOC131881994 isoform X2 [Tigriopus californicus]